VWHLNGGRALLRHMQYLGLGYLFGRGVVGGNHGTMGWFFFFTRWSTKHSLAILVRTDRCLSNDAPVNVCGKRLPNQPITLTNIPKKPMSLIKSITWSYNNNMIAFETMRT